ncbi:MAG: HIT domain-containing protein [Chloroflexi bacterium]|nr:HIT domain-containing protein [Chloroflexota bacterium]
MSSDYLWAPWRMQFIERPKDEGGGCIFCDFPRKADDPRHYIVHRGRRCFVMLNGFPYNSGHLLIAAYRHGHELRQLEPEEKAELMELTDMACRALENAYHPQGYNIGMNLGQAAGAGIPGHLHMHVVPRWNGDTNFMTVVSDARVLPEALESSYSRLRDAFLSVAQEAD